MKIVTEDEVLERVAIQEEGTADTFIDWAPEFLSVDDPPIEYLINEILPAGVIALLHGEPRARKSWAALDIAIALAIGKPAFGMERFRVEAPGAVLYCSQEDNKRLVKLRAKALCRGRGTESWPELLGFSVYKGIDLESPEWIDKLIISVRKHGIKLVVFDPIRRFSVNADKGPSEVGAITSYLRRLVNETGVTILIVHHDVKPPKNGKDDRRRGHKASGGDWFAASECPISLETAGETCSVAYPESYKLSSDPDPWTMRLITDDSRNPTIAQLVGETSTTGEAADLAIDEAVLTFLAGKPGASGNSIVAAVKKKKNDVLASLDRLFNQGKVDCVDGPRRAKLWSIRH